MCSPTVCLMTKCWQAEGRLKILVSKYTVIKKYMEPNVCIKLPELNICSIITFYLTALQGAPYFTLTKAMRNRSVNWLSCKLHSWVRGKETGSQSLGFMSNNRKMGFPGPIPLKPIYYMVKTWINSHIVSFLSLTSVAAVRIFERMTLASPSLL